MNGQLAPSARLGALVRTGPGTLAGRYLRLFWQPIFRAEDLRAGQAVPIHVMSERFTLYRGEGGTPHLTVPYCPHRQTQLSVGWVEGDSLRCRYHGWTYNSTGQCIEQPDEPTPFVQKISIKTYPVAEYLGLIFAYLGEGDPPPMRRFPTFDREGILKVGLSEVWPCNFFNRCENTIDIAHVNWAHRATRDRLKLEKQLLHATPTSAEETDYGIDHVITYSDGRKNRVAFHMPNASHVRPAGRVEGSKTDATKISVDRLFFYVPVDDESSATFVVDFVPLTGAAAEAYRNRVAQDRDGLTLSPNEIGEAILAGKMSMNDIAPEMSSYYSFWIEDYITLVGHGAIPDRQNDRLGRTDVGPILLRRVWEREMKALAGEGPVKAWGSEAFEHEMAGHTSD